MSNELFLAVNLCMATPESDAISELSRSLKDASEKIGNGETLGVVRDSDGNETGRWTLNIEDLS